MLDWATANKPCNFLLIERDLGEAPCATRVGPIAGGWWLYSSTAPYKDCNPFHQSPIRGIVQGTGQRAAAKPSSRP